MTALIGSAHFLGPGPYCGRRRARVDALSRIFAVNFRNSHTRRAYALQACCGRADRNIALEYQSGERKAHP